MIIVLSIVGEHPKLPPMHASEPPLQLHWEKNSLNISGRAVVGEGDPDSPYGGILPGRVDRCRLGQTHDGRPLDRTGRDECRQDLDPAEDVICDGVRVAHEIRSTADKVRFEIDARNP